MSDRLFIFLRAMCLVIMVVALLASHVDWRQLREEARELERRRKQYFGDR